MVHLARWQRITGWCGIFFFLFTAIAWLSFDPNLPDDITAAQFVDRTTDDAGIQLFTALASVAMMLWLFFAAGMRERLAWGLGWSPLRAIGWASAIGAMVMMVGAFIGQSTLITGGGDLGLDAEFLRGSYYALNGLFIASFAFLGLWMFTTGLAAVAWGAVPRWWGWPAIVVGLLTVAAAVVSSEFAFAGFVFWWAWSGVGGIWLAFAPEPTMAALPAATTGTVERDKTPA